jgi:hypothetical protein
MAKAATNFRVVLRFCSRKAFAIILVIMEMNVERLGETMMVSQKAVDTVKHIAMT